VRERAGDRHRPGPFQFAQPTKDNGAEGEADGIDGEGRTEADVDGEQRRDGGDGDLRGHGGGPDAAVRGYEVVVVDHGRQQRLPGGVEEHLPCGQAERHGIGEPCAVVPKGEGGGQSDANDVGSDHDLHARQRIDDAAGASSSTGAISARTAADTPSPKPVSAISSSARW
jgi:hypothetical protein